MAKIKDMAGLFFGRLQAVKYVRSDERGQAVWLFRCSCGNEKLIVGSSVRVGATRSCGCLELESKRRPRTHGLSSNPLYKKWLNMVSRCKLPKCINYKYYGGDGVTVCDEWVKNPQAFFDWVEIVGGNPSLEVDRIGNAKIYSPETCRMVTHLENMHNQRLLFKCNTSGYRGVYKLRGRWGAGVKINKRNVYLGSFKTPLEAATARDSYVKKYIPGLPLNFPIEMKEVCI